MAHGQNPLAGVASGKQRFQHARLYEATSAGSLEECLHMAFQLGSKGGLWCRADFTRQKRLLRKVEICAAVEEGPSARGMNAWS